MHACNKNLFEGMMLIENEPLRRELVTGLVFRRLSQETGETIDVYHTRLRKAAASCDFADVDADRQRYCRSWSKQRTGASAER